MIEKEREVTGSKASHQSLLKSIEVDSTFSFLPFFLVVHTAVQDMKDLKTKLERDYSIVQKKFAQLQELQSKNVTALF
jgi:hypothetical protein